MASDSPIGTPKSGYAGPKHAPFACHNCQHFQWPHLCNHPDVIADATNKGGEGLKVGPRGLAVVDAGGCCTYFRD